MIGRHKYKYLKSLPETTEEQKDQIRKYEEARGLSPDQKKRLKAYTDKLYQQKLKQEFSLTPAQLYTLFKSMFFKLENKKFIRTKEMHNNIAPLMYYFSKDKLFFECENLITKFNFEGNIKESIPSFEKGLLIIGNFGNGKTASMRVLEQSFKGVSGYSFKGITANEVVEMYENCKSPYEKEDFWRYTNRGTLYFDDVKTERLASNYGKVNILKDVLEKRYSLHKKTFITCNYKEGSSSIEGALLEFGEMYGSRVFDRLFEMFNVIEFKGKSFRK